MRALSADLADRAFRTALRSGGEFAELFGEHRINRAVSAEDGVIERATAGVDCGIGMRVLHGGTFHYGFTEDLSDEAVLALAARLAGQYRAGGPAGVPSRVRAATAPTGPAEPPGWPDMAGMADAVEACDGHARRFDHRITQVTPLCTDTVQDVTIVNSDGQFVVDRRVRVRLRVKVVATGPDGSKATGIETAAGSSGYDVIAERGPAWLAESACQQAITMLDARPTPAGEMPVILHAGSGGVLAHEACGHGLEGDIALNLRSVYADRRGEQVASEHVTLIDDPSIDGLWGSYRFDDEGTAATPSVLIDGGTLTGYLTDRRIARMHGQPNSGNGRRVSYRYHPIIRMSNTYIAAGRHAPQDLIAATGHGLYAKRLGGGSVDPTTGEFNFTVREAYLIRDGAVDAPVYGATLTGDSVGALRSIDMVADDLEFVAASCGKDGQRAWVTVGQPTVRVSSLLVAGSAR